MNQPFYDQTSKKLHSPLLDGKNKKLNLKQNIPASPAELLSTESNVKLLFEGNNSAQTKSNNEIKINEINLLENIIKGSLIFILATGGLLSILEATNIIRSITNGNYEFGNSLFSFLIAFLGTILSMIICTSFLNLIKLLKFIYLNTEEQNTKIEELIKVHLNK